MLGIDKISLHANFILISSSYDNTIFIINKLFMNLLKYIKNKFKNYL